MAGVVVIALSGGAAQGHLSERGSAHIGQDPGSRESSSNEWRPRSESCPSARKGLAFYRSRQRDWLKLRGDAPSLPSPRKPRNCADARWLASVAKKRSYRARMEYEVWLERLQTDVSLAINYVFGPYAGQAHRVVSCESGHSTTATNGQYLGLFQMGSYARSTFGHSWTALGQVRAAYRYFVASGRDWSPWSCKP